MANPLDCNGVPLPWSDQPCAPGDVDVPICYVVPPSETPLEGFKRITLLADCTASGSVILDSALVPVPGAVESGCQSVDGGGCACTIADLCAILQSAPVQVPAVGDTAIFVTPAGCFLGVPGGGGGGFPGYGVPVTTACANSGGVSLLVARADHVHRAEVPVLDEGIAVGSRCRINFIGAGVTAVDNAGLDRVDITIPATPFTGGTITTPLLGPDGTCAAPAYSFTSQPDSGMFLGAIEAITGVVIDWNNCDSVIRVGNVISAIALNDDFLRLGDTATQSIKIVGHPTDPGGAILVQSGGTNTGEDIDIIAANGATGPGGDIRITAGDTASQPSVAGTVSVEGGQGGTTGGWIAIRTGPIVLTDRLRVRQDGAWEVSGSGGASGTVIMSTGLLSPPAWTAITGFPGFGTPPANTVDAAAPTAGVAATAMRSDAKLQAAVGTPVATAQANSAGVLDTLARSDHVHRTIIQVQDAAVLVGSRPIINFIDGTNVTITAVDNAGQDRVDITIAATGSGGGAGSGAITRKVTGDSPYAVALADYTIVGDTTGGNLTITLPAAPADQRILNCKKLFGTANTLTIDGNGKNIDGIATIATTSTLGPSFQIQFSTTINEWVIL